MRKFRNLILFGALFASACVVEEDADPPEPQMLSIRCICSTSCNDMQLDSVASDDLCVPEDEVTYAQAEIEDSCLEALRESGCSTYSCECACDPHGQACE